MEKKSKEKKFLNPLREIGKAFKAGASGSRKTIKEKAHEAIERVKQPIHKGGLKLKGTEVITPRGKFEIGKKTSAPKKKHYRRYDEE